jgi:hypothetical protein
MGTFPVLWTGPNERAKVEVYLCMGQSNMGGQSDQATVAVPSAYSVLRSTLGYQPPLTDPKIFSVASTKNSSMPAFAVARWALGRRVIVLANSQSTTRLALDTEADALDGSVARWDPTAGRALPPGTGDTGVAGDLYRIGLDCVSTFGHAPRALLWFQGEREAYYHTALGRTYQQTYDRYYAALYAFVTAIKEDHGCPTIVAPVSLYDLYPGGPPAQYVPVHDAGVAVAAAHPDAYLGPLSDDLELMPGDEIHLRDVNTLGARWSAAVAAALD